MIEAISINETLLLRMNIEIKRLKLEEVRQILTITDKEFIPHLSQMTDIQQYAERLSKFAKWAIATLNHTLVGGIAYYENTNCKQIYLTYVCVLPNMRNSGVGKLLLKFIEDHASGFETVALEVNKSNTNAFRFYNNNGFVIKEDRGNRFLLRKNL